MCSLKFSSESRYAPRYLVIPVLFVTSSLTFILFVMHFSSCLGPPKYINSVLLSFMFSHTWFMQVLISCNDSSMTLMMLSSSLWSSLLDLKVFLMLWSSAIHLVWVGLLHLTSSMVEAQVMNRNAPCILPCSSPKISCLVSDFSCPIATL